MNVVQSMVARLRVAIDIQTSHGKGIRFTLDLPLTLAATLAVVIRSCGEVAAVPTRAHPVGPAPVFTIHAARHSSYQPTLDAVDGTKAI
jgi:hypothetical protein